MGCSPPSAEPKPETPKSLKKISREEFGTPPTPDPLKVQKKSRNSRKIANINYILDLGHISKLSKLTRGVCRASGEGDRNSPRLHPLHLLIPRLCRADLRRFFKTWPGELLENCRQISQRILMANFVRKYFPGLQAPPPPQQKKRPTFTPKIVGIPLQFHCLEPTIFSLRFSA